MLLWHHKHKANGQHPACERLVVLCQCYTQVAHSLIALPMCVYWGGLSGPALEGVEGLAQLQLRG